MRVLASGVAGLVFGLGLLISGMANPAKVQNFLDLAGTFDPSLVFVMLAAVVVTFLGYRLVLRRERPVLAERFSLPTAKEIDARVMAGPALFGIGWGLSGFCPGPAIASLALLAKGALVFVPTMLIGIWLARLLYKRALWRENPPREEQASLSQPAASTGSQYPATCTGTKPRR
jgi:uncharacterized membrane protein YedE/YeeE